MLLLVACAPTVRPADSEPALAWYADADGDGWGDAAREQSIADRPGGWVATPGDCDDHAPGVHPEADEHCDGADEDCDGEVDEDPVDPHRYYQDADHDGYGAEIVLACALGPGMAEAAGDCDDADPDAHPDAVESCGGGDEDCDGAEAWCRRSSAFSLEEEAFGFRTSQKERLGWALGAADVDADGITDFVIDAPSHDDEGAIFVFRGPITGDVTTDDAWATFASPGDGPFLGDQFSLDDLDRDGNVDLVTTCLYGGDEQGQVLVAWGPLLAGAWDFGLTVLGERGDYLGVRLANLGDTDGDGLPEVLSRTGDLVVLLGGFVGNGEVAARDLTRATFVSTADGFGSDLQGLGDLDGDGLGDLAITADDVDSEDNLQGRIYVLHAPFAGAVAADDAETVIEPTRGHANLARLKPVGDLDGDGRVDLAIEAQGRTEGGSGSGSVVLWTAELGSAPDLEAAYGYFTGEAAGDQASEVAGGGDLDGDGQPDLAIAAPGHADDAGKLYLAYGPFDPGRTDLAAVPASASGNVDAELGVEGALLLVPDPDGTAQVFVGAPFDGKAGDWLGSAWLLP